MSIIIRTPNRLFSGERHGILFAQGVAEVTELADHVRATFERAGYGIDGEAAEPPVTSEPVDALPSETVTAERNKRRRPTP